MTSFFDKIRVALKKEPIAKDESYSHVKSLHPFSDIGGEDPVDKKKPSAKLSYDQINKWSDYVEANPSNDFNSLYAGYSKANPDMPIDQAALLEDLNLLRGQNSRLAAKTGSDLGSGIHTGYSFPKSTVDGKDYGRVNALMQTQKQPVLGMGYSPAMIAKKIPEGTEDMWFDEKEQVVKFIDPSSGDVMVGERQLLNDPRMKKSKLEEEKLLASRKK